MDFKRKLTIGLVTACLTVSIPFSAAAATADTQKVGGFDARIVTDFESLGGQTSDSSDIITGSKSSDGVDFSVKSGFGINGSNALVLGEKTADSFFAEATYQANNDTAAKLDGLEGATDLLFYVNGGGEPTKISVMPLFGEWDYDKDGNPVMKRNTDTGNMENAITWRELGDAVDTVYYTLADGSTEWVKHTGTSGRYLSLDLGFKGYVKIAFDNFDVVWSSQDANDKVDLKHLVRFSFYYGMYARHQASGYSIAVDNIGFTGDFKAVAVDNTSSNTNTNKNTKTTFANPKTGDTVGNVLIPTFLVSGLAVLVTATVLKKKRHA